MSPGSPDKNLRETMKDLLMDDYVKTKTDQKLTVQQLPGFDRDMQSPAAGRHLKPMSDNNETLRMRVPLR